MSRSLSLFLLSGCLLAGCSPEGGGGTLPAIGGAMPTVEVTGWVNGDGPTNDQLVGKVAVIEAWATW